MATDPPASPEGYTRESAFAKQLDMRVADPDDGSSTVTMPIDPSHLQHAGRVKDGIVAALADYAFFRAVKPLLKPGESTTIEIKINFIAPAETGELTATAKILSPGRRVMVGEMEVKEQNGKLIPKGVGRFLVIQPRN